GEVKVLDTATGQEKFTLAGHRNGVGSFSFSLDGTRLAFAGGDKTVRVWQLGGAPGEFIPLVGHTRGVMGVAFSPDGSRLATAGADQTVRVWDEVAGLELLTLRGHRDVVHFVHTSNLGVADNVTETIGPLTMDAGAVVRALGNTSFNGLLILNGDVTVTRHPGFLNNPPAISGNVSLGSATRTFTLTDPNSVLDLNGVLSAGPGVGLIKEGPGLLKITGKSTYSGPTTVNDGTFQAVPSITGVTPLTLASPITVND